VTSAFSPVIPGKEYFLDFRNNITTEAIPSRYFGTAINTKEVLMYQSFG